MRQEIEYRLPFNSRWRDKSEGKARGHRQQQLCSQATRLRRRSVVFVVCIFASVIPGTSCSRHDDSVPAEANAKRKVTIVYQEDAILPENRDAIKKIRDAGVFERMADRLTKVVALPHDLQIIVTDKLPKAIDCPTTELDGRTILWPAAFS